VTPGPCRVRKPVASAILNALGIVLSLLTALSFGAADFAGGMASRRTQVTTVVYCAHVIGLIGVLAAALLMAPGFFGRALVYGAAGGLFALMGLILLYRRLAVGPMSVVAPITAITSALVPAIPAFLAGEPLTAAIALGVVLALVAIGLISASSSDDQHDDRAENTKVVTPQVLAESLGAGVGFGLFFIMISQAAVESAPWPIVGARIATVVVLTTWLLIRRPQMPTDHTTWRWVALAGLLDTFSNVLFLWSADLAGLAVASVLSSLYPASTVVLAFVLLGERMSRSQSAGFVLAIVATALIAAG